MSSQDHQAIDDVDLEMRGNARILETLKEIPC